MRAAATNLSPLPVDAPSDRARFVGPGVEEALGALHRRWLNLRTRLRAWRKGEKPPREAPAEKNEKKRSKS